MRNKVIKKHLPKLGVASLLVVTLIAIAFYGTRPHKQLSEITAILNTAYLPRLESELSHYRPDEIGKLELINKYHIDTINSVDGVVFQGKWEKTFQTKQTSKLDISKCPNVLRAEDVAWNEDQSLKGSDCDRVTKATNQHSDVYSIDRILPSDQVEYFFIVGDTFVSVERGGGIYDQQDFETYFSELEPVLAKDVGAYIESNISKMAEVNFEANRQEEEARIARQNSYMNLTFKPAVAKTIPRDISGPLDYEILGLDPQRPDVASVAYHHKNGQAIGVYSFAADRLSYTQGNCGPTPRQNGDYTNCAVDGSGILSSTLRGYGQVSRYTYTIIEDTAVVTVLTIIDKEKDTTRQDVLDEMTVYQNDIVRSLEFVDKQTFKDAAYVDIRLL